jgi:hypothetical protein
MTTLNQNSTAHKTGSFHFNIYAGVSAFGYVVAMAICALNGDFSAIPALLFLAVITAVTFSITPPKTALSSNKRVVETNKPRYFMPLLHPHCLGQ